MHLKEVPTFKKLKNKLKIKTINLKYLQVKFTNLNIVAKLKNLFS